MLKTYILFLFMGIALYSQPDSRLTGEVRTADGKPAELVTVRLLGTTIGTLTNKEGRFEIPGLSAGTYNLEISLVGVETKKIQVEVRGNETAHIPPITLNQSSRQLNEIIIRSRKISSIGNQESGYVAKIPLDNIENPQSYSTNSKELMMEQSITDFSSAVKTVPGGNIAAEGPTGITGTFIRGFQTNSFIRNGIYSFSSSGGDPQTLERIEIIRGPSGAIYGTWGIGYGGLLNKVTKRPLSEKLYSASLSFGTFNLQRYAADINLPLNENKSLLFRLNGAAHSENTFQDIGSKKNHLLMPSLYYKVNDDLNFLIEAEFNMIQLSAGSVFTGAPKLGVKRIDEIKRDYYSSYSSTRLNNEPTTLNNYFGQVNYSFNREWQLNTNISLSDYSGHGSAIVIGIHNDTLMTRQLNDFNSRVNTITIQPNLNGEFTIGGLRNRIVIGLEYNWVEAGSDISVVFVVDSFNYRKNAVPFMNVEKLRTSYNLNLFTNESRNSYGLFVSDVLNLTDALNLMLSVRYDNTDYNGIKNYINGLYNSAPYKEDGFTPQAGFTYQLINERLSIFGNYVQSFNLVFPNVFGQTFKSERAEQIEGGIKIDLTEGLYSTLSYYHISVKDKVRPDRVNPLLLIQDGTQQSRGIDVDLRLSPDENLSLITGYTYNESKYTKASLLLEGKRPMGTPKHTLNLWGSYTFSQFLTGFGFGAGAQYNSDYYFDDLNTLTIPSTFLIKLSLYYNLNKVRLSAAVDNVTDKRYWDFNGAPQMPRRIVMSLNICI